MNPLAKTTLIAALLAAAALKPAAAQPQDGLELHLELDKEIFQPGEPVVAYVRLENRGETVAQVLPALAADLQTIFYLIKNPGGEERVFKTFGLFEPAAEKIDLAPGKAIYGLEPLHFGLRGWSFPSPGRYQVRAVHQSGAESPNRVLHVVPSSRPEGVAASEAVLASRQVGKFFLFEEGDHLEEAIEILEGLSGGRSTIGAYASYMLASSWSKGFANYAAKEYRPARPDRAIRKLTSTDRSLPSFYFEAKRLLLLERNLRQTGAAKSAARIGTSLRSFTQESELADWFPAIEERVAAMYDQPSR